jgi:hypothetical protein
MVQIVAELFRVPRPLVMHANDRNYQSNRGSTLPLRSIPGEKATLMLNGLPVTGMVRSVREDTSSTPMRWIVSVLHAQGFAR